MIAVNRIPESWSIPLSDCKSQEGYTEQCRERNLELAWEEFDLLK